MTKNTLDQISTALAKIKGWGDLSERQVKITEESDAGEVIQFCIEADPNDDGTGPGSLYLTRIEHTNGWGLVSEYGGKLNLIV